MKNKLFRRAAGAAREVLATALNPNYSLKMKLRHLNVQIGDRLLRRSRVTGIEIQHTYRCNARCPFCSMGDGVGGRKDMPPELFRKVLDEARREGVLLMVFLGGESLVDDRLYEYLDLCWEAGIRTEIQSNGILLTEENLRRLKKSHVQAIAITMHGTTPAEHDAVYKVPGAFDKVMHAIDYARSIGLGISMKGIYSRQSEQDGSFRRILALAKSRGMNLNVNPFMPVGSGFGDKNRLDSEHVLKFRALATSDPCVSSHGYSNTEVCGCFAGKDYFCVTPEGDLLPCYFMPVSIGTIQGTGLREAHRVALSVPIFAKRFPLCYVAESEYFYEKFLVPLHQKYKTLPVNVLEHPEVLDLLRHFSMDNLESKLNKA